MIIRKAFLTLFAFSLCAFAFAEARANSIDDTEFFVRQQYKDFISPSYTPSNSEVFTKMSQIDSCGSNAACINTQRVLVSRAFWDDSRFRSQSRTFGLSNTSGLELYDTYDFVELSYLVYLQRSSDSAPDDYQRLGFYFWKGSLDNCIANATTFSQSSQCYNDIINAFLSSTEYRSRFGTP
jgi:hypothetical protein